MKKERKKDRRFIDKTGERHQNNQGCWFTIIAYRSNKNLDIQFDCGYKVYNRVYKCVTKGSIKNPYHPTIFGRGFKGDGRHKQWLNSKDTKMYSKWYSMFDRCYNTASLEKNPTYGSCDVIMEWDDFQIFGDWFEENFNPEYMEKWELDKDILFKGNKLYSPETCCFVPQEINKLFTKCDKARGEYPIGVSYHKDVKKIVGKGFANGDKYFDCKLEAFEYYKQEKEDYIKIVADKWRPWITIPCYNALYAYQVEITD